MAESARLRGCSRRQMLIGALGFGASALLAACAAPAPTATPPPPTKAAAPTAAPAAATTAPAAAPTQAAAKPAAGQVALRMETYADRTEFDVWKNLTDKFGQSQPNIKVTPEFITGQDAYQKYQTEMAAGTAADIMEFETKRMPSFASRDALLDLTSYVSQGKTLKKEDYFAGDWPVSFYKGKQYLLPLESVPGVFFVNLDAFDKAGVKPPPVAWGDKSWDNQAFLDTVTKLTQGDGKAKVFGFNTSTWWVYWQPFIWSNGGGILNAERTAAILDQPEAYEMIQTIVDLQQKKHFMPLSSEATEGVQNLFGGGRIAINLTNVAFATILRAMQGFKWDIRPTPAGKVTQLTRDPGNSWSGYAKTKFADATFQAIEYLSGDEAMQNTRGVPSKLAIAEAGNFPLAKIPGFSWKVLVDCKKSYRRDEDITSVFQEMDTMMTAAFDEVWQSKKDAKTLTAELKPKVDELLKTAK